ncbi:MAG: DUF4258 domain-containing protein [Dehalococcoidia bacterium]|jgi:hypothetical protein|nr:DUF4258 domain-containing protein [Dehalococcoidia bacterium]MDP7083512.1 DUF4258 domain-containing protein [Dehalococcoidia bacterium]
MKPILFSQHARDQMDDRGTMESEVEEAIRSGERLDAWHGRLSFRKNFPHRREWKGKSYTTKQVRPIVVEEAEGIIVVTVYVYYFGVG